eukprot:8961150-Ditylum_brightwellii.AAC.1
MAHVKNDNACLMQIRCGQNSHAEFQEMQTSTQEVGYGTVNFSAFRQDDCHAQTADAFAETYGIHPTWT